MKELLMIQMELKAPKDKYNKFGNYQYRSCEGILEAVKPLSAEQNCILILNDELVMIGDRYYVKATATLTNLDGKSVCAQRSEAVSFRYKETLDLRGKNYGARCS